MNEEKSKWNLGDLCLCPFSEDGLLYKATIIQLSSLNCTVRFDDYGNEEDHSLDDLHIRNEQDQNEENIQMDIPIIEKETENPSIIPPFPLENSSTSTDNLSSTLMSWYLAGYHTGYYQAMKEKKC